MEYVLFIYKKRVSLSFQFRKRLLEFGISACWIANMAAALGIAKTATEIFLGVGQVSIDNLTFKLFYKWSVTLFIVCSVLVCTSQFFGDPVQCETVRKRFYKGLFRANYYTPSTDQINCKQLFHLFNREKTASMTMC